MKKIRPLLGLVITSALLSACHDNPLKTHAQNKSATFLVNASAIAERQLRLPIAEGSLGGVYTDCMEAKALHINCKALYQAMINVAASGKYPDFKHLTLADLTDETVFAKLRDDYEEILLTTELKD